MMNNECMFVSQGDDLKLYQIGWKIFAESICVSIIAIIAQKFSSNDSKGPFLHPNDEVAIK